jgi:hypothetical protein
MAAGVTDRLWDLGDLVALIDEAAPKPGKRGPYRKAAKSLANSIRENEANGNDRP